jgi:hypothetical protein
MKKTLALVLSVALLGAVPVRALPFIDDPAVVYGLGLVNDLLREIEAVELALQLALQGSIHGILGDLAFPFDLFRQIKQTLSTLEGIREEIAALSCGWRFSPRTSLLEGLSLHPSTLCREGFGSIFGFPVGPDRDRDEIQNYVATLTANSISTRIDRSESWRLLFPDLERGSALSRVTPGEASRDEAVALSGTALVANSNSLLETESLLQEEADREEERLALRRGLDMGRFILERAGGQDPWSAADP